MEMLDEDCQVSSQLQEFWSPSPRPQTPGSCIHPLTTKRRLQSEEEKEATPEGDRTTALKYMLTIQISSSPLTLPPSYLQPTTCEDPFLLSPESSPVTPGDQPEIPGTRSQAIIPGPMLLAKVSSISAVPYPSWERLFSRETVTSSAEGNSAPKGLLGLK